MVIVSTTTLRQDLQFTQRSSWRFISSVTQTS